MPETIIHNNTSYTGLYDVNSANSSTTSTLTGTQTITKYISPGPGQVAVATPVPSTYLNVNGTFASTGTSTLNETHVSNTFSVENGLQVLNYYTTIFTPTLDPNGTIASIRHDSSHIYVIYENGILFKLDLGFNLIGSFNTGLGIIGGGTLVLAFAVGNGFIYVSPSSIGPISIFDSTSFNFINYINYTFGVPSGIAVDSNGKIYVCDNEVGTTFLFQNNTDASPTVFSTKLVTLSYIDSNNNLYGVGYSLTMVKLDLNGNVETLYESPLGLINSNYGYCAVDDEYNVFIVDNYNNRLDKFLNNGTFLYTLGSSLTVNDAYIKNVDVDPRNAILTGYFSSPPGDLYYHNSVLKIFETIKTYDPTQGVTVDVYSIRSSNVYSSDVEVYGKLLAQQTLGRYNWKTLDIQGGYFSYYNYTAQVCDNANPDSFDAYAMTAFTRDANDASGNFHLEFINRDYTYGDYGVGMGFLHNTANNKNPFIISPHSYFNFNGTYTGYSHPAISIATDGTRRVGINTEFPGYTLDVNGIVNLAGLTISGSPGGPGQVIASTGTGIIWTDQTGGGGSNGTPFTQPLPNLVVSNTVTTSYLKTYGANASVLNVTSIATVSALAASGAITATSMNASTYVSSSSILASTMNTSTIGSSILVSTSNIYATGITRIGAGPFPVALTPLQVAGSAYISGTIIAGGLNLASGTANIATLNVSSLETATSLRVTTSNIATLNISSLQTVTSLRVTTSNVETLNVSSLQTVSNLKATTSNITTLNVNSLRVTSLYGSGNNLSNIQTSGGTFTQPLANLVVSNSVTTTNIFTTGYVGIGTTSPGAMLDVKATTADTGSVIAQFGSNYYSGRIKFYDQTYPDPPLPPYIYGEAGYGLGLASQGSIKFYPNGNPGLLTFEVYSGYTQAYGQFTTNDGVGAGCLFGAPYPETPGYHNYIYSSDGSLSRIYTLAIHDNDENFGPSYAPSCMVNFSRVENNNENNFHLEFVNSSQNYADHTDYGVGFGFLDNGLNKASTGQSPFIISAHTSSAGADGFSNAMDTSNIAISIAMDGTRYVGINTVTPGYTLDVNGTVKAHRVKIVTTNDNNLVNDFNIQFNRVTVSDDGRRVFYIDEGNNLILAQYSHGAWASPYTITTGITTLSTSSDGTKIIYGDGVNVYYSEDPFTDPPIPVSTTSSLSTISPDGTSYAYNYSSAGQVFFETNTGVDRGYISITNVTSISLDLSGDHALITTAGFNQWFYTFLGYTSWDAGVQIGSLTDADFGNISNDAIVIAITSSTLVDVYRSTTLEGTFTGINGKLSGDGTILTVAIEDAVEVYKYTGTWNIIQTISYDKLYDIGLNTTGSFICIADNYSKLYRLVASAKALEVNDTFSVSSDGFVISSNALTTTNVYALNLSASGSFGTSGQVLSQTGTGIAWSSPSTLVVAVSPVTSGSYSVLASDYYIGCNGSGITILLPLGSTGKQYIIKDESGNARSNPITLSGNGYLIDGQPTITMAANYISLQVIWTGSFWSII